MAVNRETFLTQSLCGRGIYHYQSIISNAFV